MPMLHPYWTCISSTLPFFANSAYSISSLHKRYKPMNTYAYVLITGSWPLTTQLFVHNKQATPHPQPNQETFTWYTLFSTPNTSNMTRLSVIAAVALAGTANAFTGEKSLAWLEMHDVRIPCLDFVRNALPSTPPLLFHRLSCAILIFVSFIVNKISPPEQYPT